MNARDSQILSIFADALECDSPEARAEYLAQACGDDSALRSQLETGDRFGFEVIVEPTGGWITVKDHHASAIEWVRRAVVAKDDLVIHLADYFDFSGAM